MLGIRRHLRGAASKTHPLMIIWVIVMMVVCLTALTGLSIQMLCATRTFISAEDLWSKAGKDAIYYLTRYGRLHDEADFDRKRKTTSVVLRLPITEAGRGGHQGIS